MSGYNNKTGVFELTQTKAAYWLRRERWPEGFTPKQQEFMFVVAEFLGFLGYEVIKVRSSYLSAKITPEQLWEALSGQKSEPSKAEVYYR